MLGIAHLLAAVWGLGSRDITPIPAFIDFGVLEGLWYLGGCIGFEFGVAVQGLGFRIRFKL